MFIFILSGKTFLGHHFLSGSDKLWVEAPNGAVPDNEASQEPFFGYTMNAVFQLQYFTLKHPLTVRSAALVRRLSCLINQNQVKWGHAVRVGSWLNIVCVLHRFAECINH